MFPLPLRFVGLGALLWFLALKFYPHPLLIDRIPNIGLLICALATFIYSSYFPRWLLIAGCMCAGASIALGTTSFAFGGRDILPLLFGCLWAWYFTWGPGERWWWVS